MSSEVDVDRPLNDYEVEISTSVNRLLQMGGLTGRLCSYVGELDGHSVIVLGAVQEYTTERASVVPLAILVDNENITRLRVAGKIVHAQG